MRIAFAALVFSALSSLGACSGQPPADGVSAASVTQSNAGSGAASSGAGSSDPSANAGSPSTDPSRVCTQACAQGHFCCHGKCIPVLETTGFAAQCPPDSTGDDPGSPSDPSTGGGTPSIGEVCTQACVVGALCCHGKCIPAGPSTGEVSTDHVVRCPADGPGAGGVGP